jgi:hypothetical protein
MTQAPLIGRRRPRAAINSLAGNIKIAEGFAATSRASQWAILPIQPKEGAMFKFKAILAAIAVGVALALPPGAASAQTSGLGGDGYTRAMWRGTDGTAGLWKLDPALNFVGSHNYGPYAGWSPVAMTTTANNISYVLWCYTDGTASIWQVDANLNLIASRQYGPIAAWTAEGLGVDPYGNIRLVWKSTVGQVGVWTINAALNLISTSPTYGPYFGWTL